MNYPKIKNPNTIKLCDIFTKCGCKECPILIECRRPYGLGREELNKYKANKEIAATNYLNGLKSL